MQKSRYGDMPSSLTRQGPFAGHVCVCVFFYYTPFSSVARGVPYLLHIERICLPSTQLTIIKSLVGDTLREKEKRGIKEREGWESGLPLMVGGEWPTLRA